MAKLPGEGEVDCKGMQIFDFIHHQIYHFPPFPELYKKSQQSPRNCLGAKNFAYEAYPALKKVQCWKKSPFLCAEQLQLGFQNFTPLDTDGSADCHFDRIQNHLRG